MPLPFDLQTPVPCVRQAGCGCGCGCGWTGGCLRPETSDSPLRASGLGRLFDLAVVYPYLLLVCILVGVSSLSMLCPWVSKYDSSSPQAAVQSITQGPIVKHRNDPFDPGNTPPCDNLDGQVSILKVATSPSLSGCQTWARTAEVVPLIFVQGHSNWSCPSISTFHTTQDNPNPNTYAPCKPHFSLSQNRYTSYKLAAGSKVADPMNKKRKKPAGGEVDRKEHLQSQHPPTCSFHEPRASALHELQQVLLVRTSCGNFRKIASGSRVESDAGTKRLHHAASGSLASKCMCHIQISAEVVGQDISC